MSLNFLKIGPFDLENALQKILHQIFHMFPRRRVMAFQSGLNSIITQKNLLAKIWSPPLFKMDLMLLKLDSIALNTFVHETVDQIFDMQFP